MSKGETTVLGVNTSHDTAVAVVVDGEVKHVYEEERVAEQNTGHHEMTVQKVTMAYHTMKWDYSVSTTNNYTLLTIWRSPVSIGETFI